MFHSTFSATGVRTSVVPFTADEVADATLAANEAALLAKASAALAANATAIAQLDSFGAGTVALTNTQRDNALRDLARQQARAFRQLNALIKLAVRDLADTTGT